MTSSAGRGTAGLILAAGKGTRMGSESAKVLARINGRPLLGYVLDAVRPLGPRPLVVVVGHDGTSVRAAFAREDLDFVEQAEQLGTGHAVACGRALLEGFDGDVLILSGDMPLVRTGTLRRLLDHHRASGADFTVLAARPADPRGLGRVVREASGTVRAIVEERDIEDPAIRALREVNVGVYAARPHRLFAALERIRTDNVQGEYYLPDVVQVLREDGAHVEAWCGAAPEEGMGVNSAAELHRAAAALGRPPPA